VFAWSTTIFEIVAHQGENISFAESQLLIDIILNHGDKKHCDGFGNHTVHMHTVNHQSQQAGAYGHSGQGNAEEGNEAVKQFIFHLEGEDAVQYEIVHHSQGRTHDVGQDVIDVRYFVKHIKQTHVHDKTNDTDQGILDKTRA
jgi:hypothetical protein